MSALLGLSTVNTKTKPSFRPTNPFDVVSATQRLTSRGQGFAATPEYAKVISQGLVDRFLDVLIADGHLEMVW